MNIQDVYLLKSTCQIRNFCLMSISFIIPKLATYIASQFELLSKFLLMLKFPILNLGTSLCLSHFCLECGCLVFSTTGMYVCHNLWR